MKNKLTIVFLFSILCSCSDLFDDSIIEPIIIPQVIFNANGGAGTMSNQSFTVGEPQELSVNIFTRAGYTFTCWNTQADGSGISYGDKQSVIFSTETPLILYAQWEKNVTYFLVPDIDKLKLYDDSNNCTENNLIEDVILANMDWYLPQLYNFLCQSST